MGRADPTHADASTLEGAPVPFDGFGSAGARAACTMPVELLQVLRVLLEAPAGVHEADLLARLKRVDPPRWRRRRAVVPVLRRLRRVLEGTNGLRLYDGAHDGRHYWTVDAPIKTAFVDLEPPSDVCLPPA